MTIANGGPRINISLATAHRLCEMKLSSQYRREIASKKNAFEK